MKSSFTRRSAIRTGLAIIAAPTVLRYARGETPIRVGMPLALTGPAAEIGAQMRHGAEFWAKEANARKTTAYPPSMARRSSL